MGNRSDISLRHWVRPEDILEGSEPVDFIPAGGEPIVGVDLSLCGDTSVSVRGYFKDGIYYLQKVTEHKEDK